MHDFGNGRHVLHLEALRARCLHEHGLRGVPHQGADAGPDQGIVVLDLHPEALQHPVAEDAGGAVGGIGHEQVVARRDHRHQGHGERGQPRGAQHGAGGAREFAPGARQGFRGRRAGGAVIEAAAPVLEVVVGRKQHRGAAIDRRVDEAVLTGRVAPRMDEAGAGAEAGGSRGGCVRHRHRQSGVSVPRPKPGARALVNPEALAPCPQA